MIGWQPGTAMTPATFLPMTAPAPARPTLSPEMAAEVWAAAQAEPPVSIAADLDLGRYLRPPWMPAYPFEPSKELIEWADAEALKISQLIADFYHAQHLELLTDFWLAADEADYDVIYGIRSDRRPAPKSRDQARAEVVHLLASERNDL